MSIEVSDVNPANALAQLNDTAIAMWSDEKKKDFVGTFAQRARVARYILEKTAQIILDKAYERHYISTKHLNELAKTPGAYQTQALRQVISADLYDKPEGRDSYYRAPTMVGGRNITQLDDIARERSEAILKELPQLRKAIEIISPDTAKLMAQRDTILEKGNKLAEKLEEIAQPIAMSDLDQKMTIGDFRKMVKDRNKQRKKLIDALNELGEEGSELENTINKRLYRGLPGLSDAVIRVAVAHKEKSLALDEMNRRVAEKVQFGDSDAALELLKRFEQDEVKVNDAIKAEFAAAMEKLQLAGKQARRLGKGK